MQRISKLSIAALLLLAATAANAQVPATVKTIAPFHLSVSYNKTSNLIFPYAIKKVDIGNENVIAAIGVDNILQLKADKPGFEQTSVSVVTSDRHFYSFIIDFAANPDNINYAFTKENVGANPALARDNLLDEATFDRTAEAVSTMKPFLHKSMSAQKMKLSLNSIYLTHNTMWIGLRLTNGSLIGYSPEYFRFFLMDKKRGKRTASQQIEMVPLYDNSKQVVTGDSSTFYVFAFPLFTLPKTKELVIQVGEKAGGRSLERRISYQTILKTRVLDEGTVPVGK